MRKSKIFGVRYILESLGVVIISFCLIGNIKNIESVIGFILFFLILQIKSKIVIVGSSEIIIKYLFVTFKRIPLESITNIDFEKGDGGFFSIREILLTMKDTTYKIAIDLSDNEKKNLLALTSVQNKV